QRLCCRWVRYPPPSSLAGEGERASSGGVRLRHPPLQSLNVRLLTQNRGPGQDTVRISEDLGGRRGIQQDESVSSRAEQRARGMIDLLLRLLEFTGLLEPCDVH